MSEAGFESFVYVWLYNTLAANRRFEVSADSFRTVLKLSAGCVVVYDRRSPACPPKTGGNLTQLKTYQGRRQASETVVGTLSAIELPHNLDKFDSTLKRTKT
ncbi:hypothetical protein CHU98_g6700 [Xylaria longipes]|nr:hypothetical protein CHU98_g6700 [Xylaria longipes]